MDNFYDINDFIVFLIRKWKTFLVIVILGVLLFAGNRGMTVYSQYKNQSIDDSKADITQEVGVPVWSKVMVNIKLDEKDSVHILEGYRKLGVNGTVLNQMYETWYTEEKAEAQNRKVLLQEYGYILDKEVNYPYEKVDFYSQFLINGMDINSFSKQVGATDITNNIITLGFMSTNEELAKKIAVDYAEEVTKLVKKEIGAFTYKNVGDTILYELPVASAGTQPSRAKGTSLSNSNITLKNVFVQTIKGMVWGAILGVFAAVIILFFAYMMSRKIYTVSNLKKYGVTILGVGFVPRKIFKTILGKIYSSLEGYIWDNTGFENIVKKLNKQFKNQKIYVVGGIGVEAFIDTLVLELNDNSSNITYVLWNYNAELTEENEFNVIFIEKFGKSLKNELEREIEFWNKKNVSIAGVIGID